MLPLPTIAEFHAPAGWTCVDFLSDLHLSSDTPATLRAFCTHVSQSPADAIIVLGDLFEVWVGDDVRHAPFVQTCLAALRASSAQRYLGFMPGNRDFLIGDSFLVDAGMCAWNDPTVLHAWGQRVLLTHGDTLCLDDLPYQQLRTLVRNPQWQHQFLAQPLSQRLDQARAMRQASEMSRRSSTTDGATLNDAWTDIDTIEAQRWLHATQAPMLVHGHTHRPGHDTWPQDLERWVLSDWDFDHSPHRADILRLSRSGIERLSPLT